MDQNPVGVNRTNRVWVTILWAGIAAAFLIAWMVTVERRMTKLEAICHAQCKYGDEECSKRCQKAGHCEFRMDE